MRQELSISGSGYFIIYLGACAEFVHTSRLFPFLLELPILFSPGKPSSVITVPAQHLHCFMFLLSAGEQDNVHQLDSAARRLFRRTPRDRSVPGGARRRHRDRQPTRSHLPHDRLLQGPPENSQVPAGERRRREPQESERYLAQNSITRLCE